MKIKIVKYGDNIDCKINLALGFFDAVHYGHARLIAAAREDGAKTAVCIMDRPPSIFLGSNSHELHNLGERLYRLDNLGVDYAIVMHTDMYTLNTSGGEFIAQLLQYYQINKVIIGEDYTCGRAGAYKSQEVYNAFADEGVQCAIVSLLNYQDNGNVVKISSSVISEYVKEGNVSGANALMSLPYMIIGTVVGGRQIGRKEVYPTANVAVDEYKLLPLDGVYATAIEFGGKRYKSITNIGYKPTFNEYSRTIETYVLEYSGDLYDKSIALFFIDRIRDVVKFPSPLALKNQIDNDIAKVLNNDNLDNFVSF